MELDAWQDWKPNQPTFPVYDFEDLKLAYTKEKTLGNPDINCIARLEQFFSGKALGSLSADDINGYKQYRKKRGINPSTVERELAVFRAAINYARREWDIPNQVVNRKPAEGNKRQW